VIEDALSAIGISLPAPPAAAGSYVPVVVSGRLAFVSGQIPLVDKEIKFRGKVGRDITIEEGQQAARLCVINGLAQLKSHLGTLDKISRIVKVTGFVNCESTFTEHPKVINGASDLLVKIFGENGKHARAAVGMSSLPLDSAVEVEFIAELA
jgi:enamine deaminase RidA (YjgF/YER057c/UK114 family)